MTDFSQYIKQGEPKKKEKAINWQIAIGLQDVDGLKPSEYLLTQAKANIEGDITLDEVQKRITAYYEQPQHDTDGMRTEEADKVAARITALLAEQTFNFSLAEYLHIHKILFVDIYTFAGIFREYNITKPEWVLDGDTVYYASYESLKETLKYDLEQEEKFDYTGCDKQQIVEHLAYFVSHLWQIHPFGEGNTRTTAVFLIKYLRKLGFDNISNELFVNNSWYFRNALVRANYENLQKKVYKTNIYLINFLANLLLGEKNDLKNRYLHIQWGDDVQNVTDNVTDVTNRSTKIIALIKENATISTSQMARLLSVSKRTILRDLDTLKQKGKISREGSEKTGLWKINI